MITFPGVLYQELEDRADSLGLKTPEYIRHLVINDVRYPSLNLDALNESLEEAKEDVRLGRTINIDSKSDLKKRLEEMKKYV